MSQNVISRIGTWFKKPADEQQPEVVDTALNGEDGNLPVLEGAIEQRSTFLRPWAKRDQAIENLQNGVVALSELMDSIRMSVEKQSDRQDELMAQLANIPRVLEALPESSRLQAETLEAIGRQIEGQSSQQNKLAEILDRISQTDVERQATLSDVNARVESLNQHDQQMNLSLHEVGEALATVTENTGASTQVLQQLSDNLNTRDGNLQTILHRQGSRFTTLLVVAISLSVAALAAVGVFGYLGWSTLQHLKH